MICFRLLNVDEPAAPLADVVTTLADGRATEVVFAVDPASFLKVPNAPFAYWVSEPIRSLFTELPPFEGNGRTAKQGIATADDFRFVRTAWETPTERTDAEDRQWFPFAKGGSYSPFYADVFLKANWKLNGAEIRYFGDPTGKRPRSRPQNTEFSFVPGLTWSDRTTKMFSARAWPAGGIFSVKGSCGFFGEDNMLALGLMNSITFNGFLSMLVGAAGAAARSYQVGTLGAVPFPEAASHDERNEVRKLAATGWEAKRETDTANLTSHAFFSPALARVRASLADGVAQWGAHLADSATLLAEIQSKIDDTAYSLYGIGADDRRAIEDMLAGSKPVTELNESPTEDDDGEESSPSVDGCNLTSEMLDYSLGTAFGRWDIRYATGERQPPELPDPFDPLPVCPPGMLQNAEGLPAEPKDLPAGYSLRISWAGILVDDENHPEDIVARVREAIEVIWKDRAEAIEQEACGILDVKTLRDYFRRPAAFFADHLKRYSKSRRQAPIYWPLSTKSGSYKLWLYYHRLTDQTLHTCLADFLDPKLRKVQSELDALTASGSGGTRAGELREFLDELHDLRDEIERVIKLPWKPNLNDGVLITASPLHKLFRLPKWQKDLKKCWDKLEKGDFDWAHLAYTIRPRGVEKACEKDRSIAIAHGREDLCKVGASKPKKKRGKKTDAK